MSEDYDEKTVAEVRELVRDLDDVDALEQLHDHEKDTKDRSTAKQAIQERLDQLSGEDGEPDKKPDADDASEDVVDENNTPNTNPTAGERFDTVRVQAPDTGGHIAGFSFAPNEVKEVPATASIKNALMKGKLQTVA